MERLKVYGTRRRGHREHWTVRGKGVYKEIRRDKLGKLISVKNWSPKKPIAKEVFTEMQPLYINFRTGKEGLSKLKKTVQEWEWINFEAES